jgi:hypothetical protein
MLVTLDRSQEEIHLKEDGILSLFPAIAGLLFVIV